MTIHRQHLTRALMIAALAAGAWTATELATDDSAHADDKPPAATADQPGGLVERTVRLPEQAADRAKQVVAKVTVEPEPSTPAEPTEDRPRDEPTPPVEAPPADTPPAGEPVPVELPPLPTPPPVPAPIPTPAPVPTPSTDPVPPVVDLPAPLPTDGGTAPKPQDLPLPVPAPVVVSVPLPSAVDPIPAPPAETAVTQLIAGLTAGTDQPADCADSLDARRIDRDALRHLLAGLDRKPAPTTAQKPAPGCPGTPDRGTPGGVQVKPPPPSAAEMVVAYLARSHVPPVLGRLEHTRARSHLPASRHVAMEPGPA